MNRHSYWNQPINMAMIVEEWSFEKTSGVNIQHIFKRASRAWKFNFDGNVETYKRVNTWWQFL